MSELQKDVERELEKLPEAQRDAKRTKFAVFVVHNKLKPKLASLPAEIPCVHVFRRSEVRVRASGLPDG